VSTAEDKLGEKQAELDNLTDRLIALGRLVSQLTVDVGHYASENAELTDALADLGFENTGLGERIRELEDDLAKAVQARDTAAAMKWWPR